MGNELCFYINTSASLNMSAFIFLKWVSRFKLKYFLKLFTPVVRMWEECHITTLLNPVTYVFLCIYVYKMYFISIFQL